ncbi:unnamed protein product [Nippostrongylus brasiliensis]|uniref:Transmembrane protein n=1 Tax=Nippostrongylus brasiliensis TaxID=27835 RepID=A0A0N4XYY1_NIPBR|nr:unnamed protein product [Nippostrongylus brasiliensis]
MRIVGVVLRRHVAFDCVPTEHRRVLSVHFSRCLYRCCDSSAMPSMLRNKLVLRSETNMAKWSRLRRRNGEAEPAKRSRDRSCSRVPYRLREGVLTHQLPSVQLAVFLSLVANRHNYSDQFLYLLPVLHF